MSARSSEGSLGVNPTIYNVTMTLADTEYSQQISQYTKQFMVHTRDESSFRLAFETGYVATPTAPYLTIPVNARYFEDKVFLRVQTTDWDGTLYFASDSAGKYIEIVEWVYGADYRARTKHR